MKFLIPVGIGFVAGGLYHGVLAASANTTQRLVGLGLLALGIIAFAVGLANAKSRRR